MTTGSSPSRSSTPSANGALQQRHGHRTGRRALRTPRRPAGPRKRGGRAHRGSARDRRRRRGGPRGRGPVTRSRAPSPHARPVLEPDRGRARRLSPGCTPALRPQAASLRLFAAAARRQCRRAVGAAHLQARNNVPPTDAGQAWCRAGKALRLPRSGPAHSRRRFHRRTAGRPKPKTGADGARTGLARDKLVADPNRVPAELLECMAAGWQLPGGGAQLVHDGRTGPISRENAQSENCGVPRSDRRLGPSG